MAIKKLSSSGAIGGVIKIQIDLDSEADLALKHADIGDLVHSLESGSFFCKDASGIKAQIGGGGGAASGMGIDVSGGIVNLGGGTSTAITGSRYVAIAPGSAGANQLRLYAAQGDATANGEKWLQVQQNLLSFFSKVVNQDWAGCGVEHNGAGNFDGTGVLAGFYSKQFGTANAGFGSGIFAQADGWLTVWPGALRTKMQGFKYQSHFTDIDWDTDLSTNAGLMIPSQKQVSKLASGDTSTIIYLDTGATYDGNGTIGMPFNSIASAVAARNALSANNGIIVVYGEQASSIAISGLTKNTTFDMEYAMGNTGGGTSITLDNSASIEFKNIVNQMEPAASEFLFTIDANNGNSTYKFINSAKVSVSAGTGSFLTGTDVQFHNMSEFVANFNTTFQNIDIRNSEGVINKFGASNNIYGSTISVNNTHTIGSLKLYRVTLTIETGITCTVSTTFHSFGSFESGAGTLDRTAATKILSAPAAIST